MANKQLTKMMAEKMASHRFRVGSKKLSHEYFKQKSNKKKLPEIHRKDSRNEIYKKMSIAEWEAKYL